MSTWLEAVRATGVYPVAEAAGCTLAHGKSISPCPSCRAERRGGDDPRGPVGVRADGLAWRCHRCRTQGDAAAFASLASVHAPLDKTNWTVVRDWCVKAGLCALDAPRHDSTSGGAWDSIARTAREFGRFGRGASLGSSHYPETTSEIGRSVVGGDPAARPPTEFGRFGREAGFESNNRPETTSDIGRLVVGGEPRRPDQAMTQRFWNEGRPVSEVSEVRCWLETRGLDPTVIADRDLARALPEQLPPWARSRSGTWAETGHLIVFPLWGATGALESVRVRCVRPDATPAKALAPSGYAVGGLVLADRLARLLLSGQALGDGTSVAAFVRLTGVVVVEGEPDHMTWASRWSDSHDQAPAVIGVIAGSWDRALAARIPDDTPVVIRTHADEAGERYAEQVIQSLGGRCEVWRARGGAS